MSGDDKTFGISIPEVVVLHRYWMYANFMRIHFEKELTKQPPNTAEKDARKMIKDAFMLCLRSISLRISISRSNAVMISCGESVESD
jgi:hypothetical protein